MTAGTRVFRPGATLAVPLLLAAACAAPEEGSRLAFLTEELTATPYFQPYDLPVVTLADQTGAPFELRVQAAGKVTLLYFGYTSCPDVCPITMARVGRALTLLEPDERADVLPVFISVDAQRDSPEQVQRWVSALHPDVVGLTGPQEALDDAVEQLGFIFPELERPAEGFYEVPHPADLFLFTPELLGRFGYRHGDATPEEIAADIRAMLAYDWAGATESDTPAPTDLQVEAPFALDPLGHDRVAVYVTLSGSQVPDTLVGLSSPSAEAASLHRMEAEGGVMSMERVDGISVDPGATVRLRPGGFHGMLEGLSHPVAAGDTLAVTLSFARGSSVTLRVPVLHPADAPSP
jgi:cytochrome oxidase Cu insertion factor (SCO1/SenC/PrrC family)